MAEHPSEFFTQGLSVEFYDLISTASLGSVAGDSAFYLNLARQANGPVLELGAGTGRVTWALAEGGIDVVGLDISQAMLDRAEAKRESQSEDARARATFLHSDMSDFDLDRQFGSVICPFRAFQHLLTPETQCKSLTCIARHLMPGGRLVLNLFDPRLDYLLPGSDGPARPSAYPLPDDSGQVRIVLLDREIDLLAQVLREVWRFEAVNRQGEIIRQEEQILRLRWTYRREMRYLLELCGYVVEAEYSDFNSSPPAYGAEQIWVARKP